MSRPSSMETCLIEVWHEIFAIACTDGGLTGRSLSLVSKHFHEHFRAFEVPIYSHHSMEATHCLLTDLSPASWLSKEDQISFYSLPLSLYGCDVEDPDLDRIIRLWRRNGSFRRYSIYTVNRQGLTTIQRQYSGRTFQVQKITSRLR